MMRPPVRPLVARGRLVKIRETTAPTEPIAGFIHRTEAHVGLGQIRIELDSASEALKRDVGRLLGALLHDVRALHVEIIGVDTAGRGCGELFFFLREL